MEGLKTMKADFLDAHERHWDDARKLFEAQRWANADHLFGFSAECGLKKLMQLFGMNLDAQGSPESREDKVHVNAIGVRYESYREGHFGSTYELPNSFFSEWRSSQRYAHQSCFDENRTRTHQVAAEHVRGLIKKAQIDGLLL
jgi:hypothetical protein